MLFGERVPATTVNHLVPWRNDPESFLTGPFESLCASCHARVSRAEDHGSVPYRGRIDKAGRRIEPGHPFYEACLALYRQRPKTGGGG